MQHGEDAAKAARESSWFRGHQVEMFPQQKPRKVDGRRQRNADALDDAAERGDDAFGKGDYDRAIAHFKEMARLDPRSPSAYWNLGRAYEEKGDYTPAIINFSKMLVLDPNSMEGRLHRAAALINQGKCVQAVWDCCRAARIDPNDAETYLVRSQAYLGSNKYEMAVRDLLKATQLDDQLAQAYMNCAWIWATCPNDPVRDGQQAVQFATKACELSGWKELEALGVLAAAYAETGDFRVAAKYQHKILASPRLSQDDAETARFRLGLYESGNPYRDVRDQ